MASLVRIEPSKFCAGEAWFVFDDGRSLLRKIDREQNESRSDFPTPMIASDHIDPVMSMADGKYYDSKSALYRTYKPDGNPQGAAYECIGEHVAKPFERPKVDKAKRREAVDRALHDMGI